MNTLIVINHPYQGSYCRAVLDATIRGLHRAGHDVDVIDLDFDRFSPIMTTQDLAAFVQAPKVGPAIIERLSPEVQGYAKRLKWADHLIMIFPIWWELMPAQTKGFIDRVIFPGVAYEYEKYGMKSLLKLQQVTMITTMNTPRPAYRWLFGDAISRALLRGTFWKIGIRKRHWLNLTRVKQVPQAKRERWLQKIENRFAAA